MKAIVYTKYGPPDVLQLKEIERPSPKEDEILVKVYAATVNRTDNATIRAMPFFARIVTGMFKPKHPTPGTEFSGDVVAIGNDVSKHKTGDKVFGFTDIAHGTQAQYVAVKEQNAMTIPDGLSYQQAAASSEGAHYAYCSMKRAPLKKGQQALIYGASGGIGSAAVQLLKYFGLTVTAVCSTRHVELLHALGADKVIDYSKDDFTQDDQRYDYIFDAVGKVSFFKCFKLLKRGGIYISSDLGVLGQNIFLPLVTPIIKPLIGFRKTIFPLPTDIPASLQLIKTLIEQGQFKTVIDREYPLEDIAEAYKYVGHAKKQGNVVITISHDDELNITTGQPA